MISSNGLRRLGFVPDKDFVMRDDGGGSYIEEWRSSSDRPTMAAMEAAHNDWVVYHASQEYVYKRKAEYPTIEECVHAMLDDGLVELQEKRAAIKAKYPKEEAT
tara:strand:- start:517 stop:828 length:312 start_codon:yes stop_codon:yes gene_type:complete